MFKHSLALLVGIALICTPHVAVAQGEEALAISGDSGAVAREAENQDWKLSVYDIELKRELKTTQITTGYDGSEISNTYTDTASAGHVYAIVKISATRQNLGAAALHAKDARLHIGTKEFSAVQPISSFLVHHNYSVFSSEFLDKSASGAVAFEVDDSYLDTNPEGWYVSWGGSISSPFSRVAQELDKAPSLLDAQTEMEKQLLAAYDAQGSKSIQSPFVKLNPYGNTPLSAVAVFESNSAGTVDVRIKGKTSATDVRYSVSSDSAHFEVPIYGLYPDYKNSVTLTKDGVSGTFTIQTDKLPRNFNDVSVLTPDKGDLTQSGLYLHQGSYLMMFDAKGEVRWYLDNAYHQQREATPFSLDADKTGFWGTVNRMTNDVYFAGSELFHMDFVGKILTWHSSDADTDLHHGATLLGNGHLLYFSHDTIYELDPMTNTSSLYFDFNERFDRTKGAINIQNAQTSDIWHQNSLDYIAADDSILVDVRNQGMIMKLDYKTKDIQWIFTSASGKNSDGSTWNHLDLDVPAILPEDGDTSFEWFHDQHDARCISYDPATHKMIVSVFDNGTNRYNYGDMPNDDKYSRGVAYELDESTHTAKLIWQFGKEFGKANYSPYHGSVRQDSQGRYLVTYRARNTDRNSVVYVVGKNNQVDAVYRVASEGKAGGLGSYATMQYNFPDRKSLNLAKDSVSERHEYKSSYWKTYQKDLSASQEVNVSLKEASYNQKALTVMGALALPAGIDTSAARVVLVGSSHSYYFSIIPSAYNYVYGVGLPLTSLPQDNYSVSIEADGTDGKTYHANLDRYIVIGEDESLVQGVTHIASGGQSAIAQNLDKAARERSFDDMLIEKDPYGNSPLSAVALFSTAKPSAVHVKVLGKQEGETLEYDVPEGVSTHVVPIVGLYRNDVTSVEITSTIDGQKQTKSVEITTELSSEEGLLPEVHTQANDEHASEIAPGLTFVSAVGGYAYAVDVHGNIRWYTTIQTGVSGISFTKDMHLLMVSPMESQTTTNSRALYEIDLLGRVYKTYFTEGSFHHEVKQLPNGNYIVGLSLASKSTINDVFAELDPASGKLVRTFDIEAILAKYGVDAKADPVWNYPLMTGQDGATYNVNWFHNNAVFYNEKDDSFIVSSRHKSMVIKIDAQTQAIKWVLSDPTGFENTGLKDLFLKPTGELEWQYAQHAPMVTTDGDIMLFDNGVFRSRTQDGKVAGPDNYSRVVKYHVDEQNMTVEQVYSFGKDFGSEHYCVYIGDVDELGASHYLMDFGGHVTKGADGAALDIPVGYNTATLFETKDNQVIWQLDTKPTGKNILAGIYRAERVQLTSLPNQDSTMSDNFWLGTLPENATKPIALELGGSATMEVGQMQQLTLQQSPADSSKRIRWISDQPGIATVDANGQVSAHMPGSVTVRALSDSSGLSAAKRIEISGFAVKESKLTLRMQESYQLQAATSDEQPISYSSDDESIAIVDESGMIYAHEKGSTLIHVRHGSKTCDVEVQVNPIVADGVYTITSAINDRFALDITGASTQNSAKLQLWDQHQGNNQQFKISYEGQGAYSVSPQTAAGKVLDIEYNSKTPGAPLIQYDDFGADNQRFYIEGNETDGYSFISASTGYAMDVSYGIATNGARVIMWPKTGAKNQRFQLHTSFKDGIYTIHPKHAKQLVLDVSGDSLQDGAPIATWNQTGGLNQRFLIQNVGGGYYTITSVSSGKVLDIKGANAAIGAELNQWTANGANNQKWRLIFHPDNTVSFESALSGKVLDVVNGKTSAGTSLCMWDYTGADWQKFVLDSASQHYMIQSALDENLVLDIAGASTTPEASLILWNKTGAANQQFFLSRAAYTTITSVHSLQSLDIRYGSLENGAVVQQYPYGAKPWQRFYLEYAGDGYYYIRSAASGKVLDVEYGDAHPGARILLWDKTGRANQKFKLVFM